MRLTKFVHRRRPYELSVYNFLVNRPTKPQQLFQTTINFLPRAMALYSDTETCCQCHCHHYYYCNWIKMSRSPLATGFHCKSGAGNEWIVLEQLLAKLVRQIHIFTAFEEWKTWFQNRKQKNLGDAEKKKTPKTTLVVSHLIRFIFSILYGHWTVTGRPGFIFFIFSRGHTKKNQWILAVLGTDVKLNIRLMIPKQCDTAHRHPNNSYPHKKNAHSRIPSSEKSFSMGRLR